MSSEPSRFDWSWEAPYDRLRILAAAQAILDRGGWCVLELCVHVPDQPWEVAALIFDLLPEAVADAVTDELAAEPSRAARLTGCNRRTLQPDPAMGAYVCHLSSPSMAFNQQP